MTNLVMAKSSDLSPEPEGSKPSPAVQDYLRVIYKLSRRTAGGRVLTNQLAEALHVRPASVTGMLQKMAAAEPVLVDYHKHHGVRLSAAGEVAALQVVRRHRLLELFLHEKLGYSWDEVHDEADQLEHVVSDKLIDRLDQILGHPTTDPHGHAIPTDALIMESVPTRPLSELQPGDSAVVVYVRDDEPALLRQLESLGVRPGLSITVLGFAPGDDAPDLVCAGGSGDLHLGPGTAGHIFVRRAGDLPA